MFIHKFGSPSQLMERARRKVTSDILHIREKKEKIKVDCSHLVGCSDYKIPQDVYKRQVEEIAKRLKLERDRIEPILNMLAFYNLIQKEDSTYFLNTYNDVLNLKMCIRDRDYTMSFLICNII